MVQLYTWVSREALHTEDDRIVISLQQTNMLQWEHAVSFTHL